MSSTRKLKRLAKKRSARSGEPYQSALQRLRNAHSSELGFDRKPDAADAAGQQPSAVAAGGEMLEAASTAGQQPSAAEPVAMSGAPSRPEAGLTWLSDAMRATRELVENLQNSESMRAMRATRELVENLQNSESMRATRELVKNL